MDKTIGHIQVKEWCIINGDRLFLWSIVTLPHGSFFKTDGKGLIKIEDDTEFELE